MSVQEKVYEWSGDLDDDEKEVWAEFTKQIVTK